jgi:allantoicase
VNRDTTGACSHWAFQGNHPAFACVEGVLAPADSSFESLTAGGNAAAGNAAVTWHELLPQVPLRPSSQNLFAALPGAPAVSHVRLNIFPDGGVARLRVFGNVEPLWSKPVLDPETQAHVTDQVDLVALRNGGLALACSDAHFGPMNNVLLPGRAEDMGGGWETRRNRGPGHDWVLLRLAARGTPEVIEIDTNHFKGNYPDRCSVQVIDASASRITDLIASGAWMTVLPESKLQAHTRHFFKVPPTAASHLRINIFPDGGISRVRAWGHRL